MQLNHTISIAGLLTILVGLAVWMFFPRSGDSWRPPTLDASALASLQPDAEGDERLLDHLRALSDLELSRWRDLPPAGQTLFATLWAEEIQHMGSWAQLTVLDSAELQGPTLPEIADAYAELGIPATAQAIRRLAASFEQDRTAMQNWIALATTGNPGQRPDASNTDAMARAAFSHLHLIRPVRLAFARANTDSLHIR